MEIKISQNFHKKAFVLTLYKQPEYMSSWHANCIVLVMQTETKQVWGKMFLFSFVTYGERGLKQRTMVNITKYQKFTVLHSMSIE